MKLRIEHPQKELYGEFDFGAYLHTLLEAES